MPTARRRRRPNRPPVSYYFKLLDFEGGYTYSSQNPDRLSKREVNLDHGGARPTGPVTFESIDLELRVDLLEPLLPQVTATRIDVSTSRQSPETWAPYGVGLLTLRKHRLTGSCWIPALGTQALLGLLNSGRKIYICLDSEKPYYGRATIHHFYWYTDGHAEVAEWLTSRQ